MDGIRVHLRWPGRLLGAQVLAVEGGEIIAIAGPFLRQRLSIRNSPISSSPISRWSSA